MSTEAIAEAVTPSGLRLAVLTAEQYAHAGGAPGNQYVTIVGDEIHHVESRWEAFAAAHQHAYFAREAASVEDCAIIDDFEAELRRLNAPIRTQVWRTPAGRKHVVMTLRPAANVIAATLEVLDTFRVEVEVFGGVGQARMEGMLGELLAGDFERIGVRRDHLQGRTYSYEVRPV